MTNKYYVSDNAFIDSIEVIGTLADAKALADERASRTEQNISIADADGNTVAVRNWVGVRFDPEEADEDGVIVFGDYGYFEAWAEL